ncbi:MAG: hypothetical protein AMJ46_00300 [Latescibacteria bacterium DG_63]|nr:MAG: hypothetical protein AMJ46_00300 [Latescibacteria bacterium DG_63]
MEAMKYKADVLRELRRLRRLAEAAASQLNDDEFFAAPDVDSNSVAVIVKHMAGNMHSRWRDFLTSDGEKPDRNRDAEFEISLDDTRSSLTGRWNEGWSTVFEAIGSLGANDFDATVYIRGEPHTVLQAINRQLTHYSYHVGQIIFAAKQIRGAEWRILSVPKGKSEEFNIAPQKYIDERDV